MYHINGLCLIPESRFRNKRDIDNIIKYANRNSLGVAYLTYSRGFTYVDDILFKSKLSLNSFSKGQLIKWSFLVAEQIRRVSIEFMTANIFLMVGNSYNYRYLISRLKTLGFNVVIPMNREIEDNAEYTKDN